MTNVERFKKLMNFEPVDQSSADGGMGHVVGPNT